MPDASHSQNCVLLADQHHGLSAGIRGLLERRFRSVFMVADAASLLDGAERLRPTLLVVDLALAGGDLGLLVRALRDRAPMAKLLLLSVHDEPTVLSAALAGGADGVIVKRAIGTELLTAVDLVLAGGRYASPGVTTPSSLPRAAGGE